jgi:CDP-Glycerol:Poly(glycerophosphate) glycerophosphotransferase
MTRQILVDARTAVNYTMFAPVHAAMRDDDRVSFAFTASEEPDKAATIFRDAGADARLVNPKHAAVMKFDAYVTSDFMWTPLFFKTCRIQMFHGVGGKYGFDAPTDSLRPWHRLFFVNRRRLQNFIKAGAVDANSDAPRLVGMPKVDRLVDGSIRRDAVLRKLRLDPARPTILYAPTWSAHSSLNLMGVDLVERLLAHPWNLIVKLHDRSRDPREFFSGGVDWVTRLNAVMTRETAHLAADADICAYLAAADAMITDHSSAGFEYLLLDRPLVRIHIPDLIRESNINEEYVALMQEAAASVETAAAAVTEVERGLADPSARSMSRHAVAEELFYKPGTATARAVAELYDVMELSPLTEPSPAVGRAEMVS